MSVMRIKECREAVGITPSELALKMGVVPGAVSNWESEIALPKTRDLPKLAEIFGCSIDALFRDCLPRERMMGGNDVPNPATLVSDAIDSALRGPLVSSFDPDSEI